MKPVGAPSYTLGTVIDYNASESQFVAALNTFDFFSSYSVSANRTAYDSSGAVTTDPTLAVTYTWIVSVWYLRPTAATKIVFTPKNINCTGTFTQSTVKPHGPVIVGSFGLSMAGTPVTSAGSNYLRYNIASWDLQSSIRQIPGFELTEVNLLTNSNYAQYGSTWLISFIGANGIIPLFTTDNTFLLGGASGTVPQLYSI